MQPKACVLKTGGTNCDRELKYAINLAGGDADIIHINSFVKEDPIKRRRFSLEEFDILAIPGGFSYGDYIRAGAIFADEMKTAFGDQMYEFVEEGGLVIGICNGFQVLVQTGLLPRLNGNRDQTVSLTYNESGNFECRWTKMISPKNKCIWTKGIDKIDLPVAHGEGNFTAPSDLCNELFNKKQVVFQYANKNGKATMEFPDNPNGSMYAIAGICDETGRVFGLMPHPERYTNQMNHSSASLQRILGADYIDQSDPFIQKRIEQVGLLPEKGLGLKIFENAINHFIKGEK